MPFTRRQFLKGATAAAALASSHVLGRVRPAHAAVVDPILVLINLNGGNDPLNTLVPMNNVGAPQRALYDQLRPDLAIPISALGATEIAPDPVLGTRLALHPQLTGLKGLFDEGKVALINGAGIANSSLSHFVAEDVWFTANPDGRTGTGWVGRHVDETFGGDDPRVISFGTTANTTLAGAASGGIATVAIDLFDLPEDRAYKDLPARRAAWETIFADGGRAGRFSDIVARSGGTLVEMADVFGGIQTRGWGSRNDTASTKIGRELRDVASILRHDQQFPGSSTELRFFHTAQGGFDTHASQGALDPTTGHPMLMRDLDQALTGFQRDIESLGVADRVITLAYSEFGRRASQNGTGSGAGTDHGRGGLVVAVGSPVAGGHYGRVPGLDDLDADGNLKVLIDFRRIYTTVIDQWLGGDHRDVLPGAPFSPVSFLG
jgi:uncharacterized protein (DUF1501 family)